MTENQTYAPENSLILHKIGQLHIIRNFGPIGQNYEGFYDVKKNVISTARIWSNLMSIEKCESFLSHFETLWSKMVWAWNPRDTQMVV